MNITEALKAIENTQNRCSRPTWDGGCYIEMADEIAELALEDLMADDWQVEVVVEDAVLSDAKLEALIKETVDYLDEFGCSTEHERFIMEISLKAYKKKILQALK